MADIERLKSELAVLSEKVERADKVEMMLEGVRRELSELSSVEFDLRAVLKDEKDDVDKLEGTSLSAILTGILGTKEARLDKERREYAAAKLKYDSVKAQLDETRTRFDALVEEKRSAKTIKRDYEKIRLQLRDAVRKQMKNADELCSLEEEHARLNAYIRELDEAIRAGRTALRQVSEIETSLNSAKNWGVWDVVGGGGVVTTIAKHSHLDDAQNGVIVLQHMLNLFRDELADANSTLTNDIGIGSTLRFADYFFDGIIVDWAVLSRISSSQEQMNNVRSRVSGAISKLEAKKSVCATSALELEKRIDAIYSEQIGEI